MRGGSVVIFSDAVSYLTDTFEFGVDLGGDSTYS